MLTCGHILRDVKEESRIEVDVFDGNRSHTFRGSIVKFDLEGDVGLLTVATASRVTVAPVAAVDGTVRPGDPVVSIGCSQGEIPSVEQLRVTMLNRYLGPDSIECTGVPGQGRSGGGLFTTSGSVCGICTNADPGGRRGVYAGLKPIHALLKRAGLDELDSRPGPARPGEPGRAPWPSKRNRPPAAETPRESRTRIRRSAAAPASARRARTRPATPWPGSRPKKAKCRPKSSSNRR